MPRDGKMFEKKDDAYLRDSGEREVNNDTGMQRDTRTGKGRFDLIPPTYLKRLARLYEEGAVKYDDRNWEKGGPLSRFMDSALRHINDYREGCREEDHLVQATWNLIAIIHFEEMIERGLAPKDFYDFPSYLPDKKEEWANEEVVEKSFSCGGVVGGTNDPHPSLNRASNEDSSRE